MKNYLVEFTEKGARIYKDPVIIEQKKNNPNVLLNPELPKGVSPSFWIKDGNYIGIADIDSAKIILNKQNLNKLETKILTSKLISKNTIYKPKEIYADPGTQFIPEYLEEKQQKSNNSSILIGLGAVIGVILVILLIKKVF